MRVGCVSHACPVHRAAECPDSWYGHPGPLLQSTQTGTPILPLPHSKPGPWLKPRRHHLLGFNKDPIGIC